MNYGTIALIAVAILLLTPLSRIVLALVFGQSIGEAALKRQPDTIHLKPTEASKLRHAAHIESVRQSYLTCGFVDAGVYSVPEMPGVSVQLLAHEADSMYAAIYDHPVAGVFFDVVNRYADGSSWTFTTARPTGINQRPNTRMVNMPGAEPAALIDAARRDRPHTGLRSCGTSTAVSDFEHAYAEYMAWMKQRGLSTREVVSVASRKVA